MGLAGRPVEGVFERKDLQTVAIRAGMERTHLKLYPGEEISTAGDYVTLMKVK